MASDNLYLTLRTEGKGEMSGAATAEGTRPETPSRTRLGEILVRTKAVTQEQLEMALELQKERGGRLGEILVQLGIITPAEVAAALSVQLNVPIIDLKAHPVTPEVLRLIPEETARKHTLIPLAILDGHLVVVMTDPGDIRALEELEAQARMRVKPAVAARPDILEAINLHYKAQEEIRKQVEQMRPPAPPRAEVEDRVTSNLIAAAPAVRAIDLLVSQAVKDRASDIHIELQESRLRIRYRIDGILHDVLSLPLSVHAPLVSRVKILAGMDIAERRRPQDGQFTLFVGDREVNIRAATCNTAHGELVVLRVLDKSVSLRKLTELGLSPVSLRAYHQALRSPFGMILASGPTGSGKTTTLYASLNQLDRGERNIMTIEDPIEYSLADIVQIEVNPKAGLTFANGLRAIVRLDPDVILVGEIRDGETARIAIQAALTGHLVLSSVHANDAVGVLFRLMDLGVEPFLVASALVCIVAQRLVRQVCPYCKALRQPSLEEVMAYQEEIGEAQSSFYYGEGCNFCSQTGYLGRTGIFEVLMMNEDLRRSLMKGANAHELKEQAIKGGMVPMWRDGMLKVKAGLTTPYEVMRNAFSLG